jgi:4-oxalocrotonate tautomerase
MPTVHIELFPGRTIDQKRACAVAVSEAIVKTLGGTYEGVDIVFTEVEKHNWATGGQLWADKTPAPKPGT